ncbi:MAG TPA: nuclear transport factor 2 family protein [Thermomicrobiaceae bacterium]|nr:nuclear transport factor 2 family protein [Thermomicrobiaceae bacterium]
MATAIDPAIRRWLEEFAGAVRDVDYARGATMVAPEVVGFGTHGGVLVGRDALVAGQWRNVWGVTRGFTFRLDDLRGEVVGERAWVAVPWDSQGRDDQGAWYDRPGRATIVLERRDGRWLAVHTHFSLYPPTAARPAR